MIVTYEGIPGSAKTYSAVKKIVEMLIAHRVVYTNIEGLSGQERDDFIHREALRLLCGLSEDEFKSLFRPLDKENAARFWEVVEPGSIIILDEVHKLWSNREWQTGKNKAFADWCSTHRHEGFDLILITQKIEKLDAHVRSLVEWTYRYKKINYFGKMVTNRYTESVYFEDDTTDEVFKRNRYCFDPKIFKAYKSYASRGIKEQGLAQSHNVLKHPIFFILPLVFIAGFYMLIFKSGFIHGSMFGIQVWGEKKAYAAEPKKEDKPGSLVADASGNTCAGGAWVNGKCVPGIAPISKDAIKIDPEPAGDVVSAVTDSGVTETVTRVGDRFVFVRSDGKFCGSMKILPPEAGSARGSRGEASEGGS